MAFPRFSHRILPYPKIILSYFINWDWIDRLKESREVRLRQFSQNFNWDFLPSLSALFPPFIFLSQQDRPFGNTARTILTRRPRGRRPAATSDPFRFLLLSRGCFRRSRSASHGGEGGVGPAGVRSRVALMAEPDGRARFSSADISNAATYPAGRSAPRRGDARASLKIHPLVRERVQAARQGRRAARHRVNASCVSAIYH